MDRIEREYRKFNEVFKEIRVIELTVRDPERRADLLLDAHDKLMALSVRDSNRNSMIRKNMFYVRRR